MKLKIHVGKTAPRRKAVRIKVGASAGARTTSVVYERTTCCWSIRQTASQVRRR